MGIASELSSIKTNISDKIVANKVSRFAYKEQAYTNNDANGVTVYDVNHDNNIPVGTASVMKVNDTVIEFGWRARASSITRMLMNHFLGRVSYNLNKANDMINEILVNFISYIGQADGIATLDSNGKLPASQLGKSDVASNNSDIIFTAKGAYDYLANSTTSLSWLIKVFGSRLGLHWKQSSITTGGNFKFAHGNGVDVAVNTVSNQGYAYYSLNKGKTWTACPNFPSVTGTLPNVYYANGVFICSINNNGIWKSTDGINWVQSDNITTGYYTNFTFGNGIWLCSGSSGNVYKSADNGATWLSVFTSSYRVNNFTFYNTVWLCTMETSSAKYVYKSEDNGDTWSSVSGVSASNGFFIGNGVILASDSRGYNGIGSNSIYLSVDGVNWSTVSTDFGARYLAHEGNIWIAGTAKGYGDSDGKGIYYSLDNGHTWTQSSTTTLEYGKAVWYKGVWIIRGDSGAKPRYSLDNGNTWVELSALSYSGEFYNFNDSLIYINEYGIYHSQDGIYWTLTNTDVDTSSQIIYVHSECFGEDYILTSTTSSASKGILCSFDIEEEIEAMGYIA